MTTKKTAKVIKKPRKTAKQIEAEKMYPEFVYINKHGNKVALNETHAKMYGDKMKPVNKNAKELVPPEKNARGEIVSRTIHK